MRVELTGRHLDITPALRRLVTRRLDRLDRILRHDAVSAHVVLTREKRLLRTDLTLHARGEKFLHGASEASTWVISVGEAVEKIAQQASQIKGKREEWKRRRASRTLKAPGEAIEAEGGATGGARPVRPKRPRMFRRVFYRSATGEFALVETEL
jgi:putative sigma-54 modulation protein